MPRNRKASTSGSMPMMILLRARSSANTSLLLDGSPSAEEGWDGDLRTVLPVGSATGLAGGEFIVTVQVPVPEQPPPLPLGQRPGPLLGQPGQLRIRQVRLGRVRHLRRIQFAEQVQPGLACQREAQAVTDQRGRAQQDGKHRYCADQQSTSHHHPGGDKATAVPSIDEPIWLNVRKRVHNPPIRPGCE